MKQRGGFLCVGYISISPTSDGVLYPIFRHGNLNWPFVQEVDEDGKISAFLEFYDTENFTFLDAKMHITVRNGDESIYAFLDNNRQLRELSYSELGRYVRMEGVVLNDGPACFDEAGPRSGWECEGLNPV